MEKAHFRRPLTDIEAQTNVDFEMQALALVVAEPKR